MAAQLFMKRDEEGIAPKSPKSRQDQFFLGSGKQRFNALQKRLYAVSL
jgi:hypothetical protein